MAERNAQAATPSQTTRPEPQPSASLVLLRSGREAIEVFMVLRNARASTFSGALVFPGGCIDPGDDDPRWRERCSDAGSWSDAELARRVAAIREGFEEGGVLLARDRGSNIFVDPGRMADLGTRRQAILDGTETFLDFVRDEDIELATDRLVRIGHWVTPAVLKRRFDTVFYAARVPRSLALTHDGSETVESLWAPAEDLLADAERGRWQLIFPTRCNLQRVAGYDSVQALLAGEAARPACVVEPLPERDAEGIVLRIPREAGYPVCSERMPDPRGAAAGAGGRQNEQ